MHLNILADEQQQLLPFIQTFEKEYYMVGGTAISLQIGHRQSIDFDMFKLGVVQKKKIIEKLAANNLPYQLLFSDTTSLHLLVNGVKITFFQYPFKIKTTKTNLGIKMPDLLTLAAMKAYALGRRAKWKDYVDLFFILKNYYNLEQITQKASEIFEGLFSAKLFRQQLCYFEDIDYTEEVSYLPGYELEETFIKDYLINTATNIL